MTLGVASVPVVAISTTVSCFEFQISTRLSSGLGTTHPLRLGGNLVSLALA